WPSCTSRSSTRTPPTRTAQTCSRRTPQCSKTLVVPKRPHSGTAVPMWQQQHGVRTKTTKTRSRSSRRNSQRTATMRRGKAADKTPLDGIDLLLADLDGVVYKGKAAIPHAVDAINQAAERMRVGYVTNN